MEEPLIRTLEEQIAEKIKNYRKGTGVYDAEHVDRWISQFPEEERMVVLTETNRLLEQNYVDQAKLMEWERYIETNADIMGADPQKTISKSQFLDIQTKGNSQKRLVPMVESYLQACGYTGVNTCAPGEVRNYFYLDDCLFTGMTLLKDVGCWMETENPNPGSTLKVIYIAGYNGALPYVKKRLEEICAPKHIKAEIHLMRAYKNDMHQPQPYDILWPRQVKGDPYVDQYMAHLEELKASSGRSGIGFRKGYSDGESELFTSGYNRYVLEPVSYTHLAWEPYGYRKSEHDRHQLVVDEEAAVHLREIFSMYMDGFSYSDIAKKLNADGVLSPTLQREYYKTREKPLPESKPWNNYEVKRVLQDVHCTGDCVFGKYQQSVFQGNKLRNCPESEWIYAENTHEGIIDKELFQQVQEKIRIFTEEYKKKHQLNNGATRKQNFYTGKIWCGGCGNRMALTKEKSGTFYYICGADANHKSGGNQCKGHRVRKEYVDDDVLRLIQTHMKTVLDTEKMIQEMNAASKNQTQYLLLDKEVGKLRWELSRISKRKSDLYEDYSEDVYKRQR